MVSTEEKCSHRRYTQRDNTDSKKQEVLQHVNSISVMQPDTQVRKDQRSMQDAAVRKSGMLYVTAVQAQPEIHCFTNLILWSVEQRLENTSHGELNMQEKLKALKCRTKQPFWAILGQFAYVG